MSRMSCKRCEEKIEDPPPCFQKCQSKNKVRIDKPILWILGGPGSGKGTQCDKIIAKYGFTHLSTGDLLRDEVHSGSELGKQLSDMMEKGELVPTEVVLNLLKRAIEKHLANSKGFLIDGYPREKSQGIAFEKLVAPCTVIIYFEATTATLTTRLLGRAATSGRADDNEETIKKRVKTFLENNEQVLAQYPDKLKRQLTVDLIKEEMLMQQEAKGFILVGFPKSPRMSSIFHRQVKWPEKIVALEVDDEVAATRLQNKLSELGRPESEINAARQIVKDAAHKVKNVHKRLGGHIVTLDSSSNPKALASTLKEILSDMLEQDQQEEERQTPGSEEEEEVSSVAPVEVELNSS